MKQIALSLFVIAISGVYVWDQSGKSPADDMLGSAMTVKAADVPVKTRPEPASVNAWQALPNHAASPAYEKLAGCSARDFAHRHANQKS
jgi:hypothetical protein